MKRRKMDILVTDNFTLKSPTSVANYEEMWECLELNKTFDIDDNWREFSS